MEIKETIIDDDKLLSIGDFVTDITANDSDAILGVVAVNNDEFIGITFIGDTPRFYVKEAGKNYCGFEHNSRWYKLSKQEALKFIAKQNPDGFTVNKNTLEPITSGWAVAVSETQNSFGEEGLKQVIEHAEQKSYIEAIGGWLNSKDGQYYFDAVMVVQDYETAAELGYRNKQKAVFNLSEGKEYELK